VHNLYFCDKKAPATFMISFVYTLHNYSSNTAVTYISL